ncbi:hypothetical protein ACJIZ3_025522 [Penstemon smallii]|uniref:Uncharacterized protein n=1 Tax=Penstemon smallii TaxID=265156 RepID=A0ABD3TWJ3_9LAMI
MILIKYGNETLVCMRRKSHVRLSNLGGSIFQESQKICVGRSNNSSAASKIDLSSWGETSCLSYSATKQP